MKKQDFKQIKEQFFPWIQQVEDTACRLHQQVNQMYDGLPYGFHLKLAASYVSKYGDEVAEEGGDVLTLYAATYLHDSIEDARLSYNDLVRLLRQLNEQVNGLPEEWVQRIEFQVPEIVYVLTNEKGRSRKERAGEKYYKGIRETRLASFVKLCDRMANIRYATMLDDTSRMATVYRSEHADFIEAISKGAVTSLPEEMLIEAAGILDVKNDTFIYTR